MTEPISILHIGVPMDHPSIPDDLRPRVRKGLQEIEAALSQAGFDYSLVYYSPESGLDGFAERLRRDRCDGVVVGGGVTSVAEMTYFMEQIVDTTHRHAPDAKIMFIHGPEVDEVRDAVGRWFGRT